MSYSYTRGTHTQFYIACKKYTLLKEKGKKATHKGIKRCWWFTPVILATQEAEIRRTTVQSQPGQIVPEILAQKNPTQKKAGGVAQGVGSAFKPQ
jgi:hypothetical protein